MAFSSDVCKIGGFHFFQHLVLVSYSFSQCWKRFYSCLGAEMEFSFHDGTIRDVVFLEDSVNRYFRRISLFLRSRF